MPTLAPAPTQFDYALLRGRARTSVDQLTYLTSTLEDLADYCCDTFPGIDVDASGTVTEDRTDASSDKAVLVRCPLANYVDDTFDADHWYDYHQWLTRRRADEAEAARAIRLQSQQHDALERRRAVGPAAADLPLLMQDADDELVYQMGYLRATYQLFLRFRDGSLYVYCGVVPGHWHRLRRAQSSVGRYLERHVFGKVGCHRLEGPATTTERAA